MDFNQTYSYISVGNTKNWLDFGDLDIIFKVIGGHRMLKNALFALYLLKGWMDFKQICTDKLLGNGKELIRFWFVGRMRSFQMRYICMTVSSIMLLPVSQIQSKWPKAKNREGVDCTILP